MEVMDKCHCVRQVGWYGGKQWFEEKIEEGG